MAWTDPTTRATGDLITASIWNTDLVNNLIVLGKSIDYVEATSNLTVTATTEGTAQTAVTGAAIAYDGSTRIIIKFYTPRVAIGGGQMNIWLYDGSSSIGQLSLSESNGPVCVERRLTPAAATKTYSVRASVASGSGTVNGSAGGTGAFMPCFMHIYKA